MENIIQIKIEIDCSISRAFNMFTTNSLLEVWLTEKAEVEPKVGGKYELFWEPEKRNRNSTLGCKITAIETNKFLSFNWKGPIQFEHFMNSTDPLTHVIVFFSSNNNDNEKSTIYLFHTGWRKEEHWQEARNYFEKAWTNALNQLKTVSQKEFLH
ncbi:MAG: SRPBCC domain-containing protein [Candidatus Thorarchaeota archaeon]